MWDPYECVAHPPDIPNLITDATKILEVDRELIGPCLDELVAAEGVVRELVPGEGGDLLPAVYLGS